MSIVSVIDRVARAIERYLGSLARMIMGALAFLAVLSAIGCAIMTVIGFGFYALFSIYHGHLVETWPALHQFIWLGLASVAAFAGIVAVMENKTVAPRRPDEPSFNIEMNTSAWR